VPLPWSGEAVPFGFGPEGSKPWLPQPAVWADLTVARELADPASMLSLYRSALHLRRQFAAEDDLALTWLAAGPDVLAFCRQGGFSCVVNLGDSPISVPVEGHLLLASGPLTSDDRLPAAAAAWFSSS